MVYYGIIDTKKEVLFYMFQEVALLPFQQKETKQNRNCFQFQK